MHSTTVLLWPAVIQLILFGGVRRIDHGFSAAAGNTAQIQRCLTLIS